MRILQILALAMTAAALAIAITPGTPSSSASKSTAKSTAKTKAAAKAPAKKKYLSSSRQSRPAAASRASLPTKSLASAKPATTASKAPPAPTKPADPAKPAAPAKTVAPTKTAAKPLAASKRPAPIPTKVRLQAHEAVYENVASGAEIPVENAAALIPFFEQLYRHQQGKSNGPVRILHYGDSHTAADEWTGEMRARLQEKFGDGGSGYSFAGRPWNGYRREDVRSGSTRGWHTDGLVGRAGDGVYGLGGISMSVRAPREAVYVEADASDFELYYYQQPGGGALQLYDNGVPVERISTDGEPSPATITWKPCPGRIAWSWKRWITRRCACSDGSRRSPPA